MAKYTRTVVGSVMKNKDSSKPDYIRLRGDTAKALAQVLMKADNKTGQILNLESRKFQEQSLDEAVKAGKLSEDVAAKRRESIAKTPDYVRFSIILVEKSE